MALEGEVKLPGGAKVSKKAAAGGLVVVVTLIGVYYWKKRSSASSAAAIGAAAATTTDQYPPDGTTGDPSDPYSTDPATGQTYGDEAAGTGTLGAYGGLGADLYPPDGTTGNPNDPYSIDPATGVTYGNEGGGGGGGTGTGTGGPPFTSNSAWSNWVVQQDQTLNPDVNVGDLINALGLYLEGSPVTAAQKTLIFDAIAIGGDPPISGANGYPPKVRTQGNGGGTTETVPGVVGKDADSALAALKTAHLVGKLSETRKAGHTYTVHAQSPAAGKRVAENSTVKLTITEKPSTGKPERTIRIPTVTGESADDALKKVRDLGFEADTSPVRDPRRQYIATGTRPTGDAKQGSKVTVTVREKKK